MIGSALDAGADGVLVPQVESRAEAETVVAAARFAPAGSRGAHPWVRAAAFSGDPDWFRRTNEETAVLVMIEGKEGVAAAADIIATPDLDGVFLGPVDLSHALGVPGNIDHPDVIARVTEVVGMAKEQSKTAAVFTPTSEGAKRWLALGANMVAVGTDTAHFMDVLRQLRSEIS
jgi:4-hydroxy-2-oxoheptanedioate aldolase